MRAGAFGVSDRKSQNEAPDRGFFFWRSVNYQNNNFNHD